MLANLPLYLPLIFGLIAVLTLILFYRAIKNSNSQKVQLQSTKILIGLLSWLTIQAVLTLQNVYSAHIDFFPPSILLFGIFPAIFTILVLFLSQKGRKFIESLSIINLTYLHVVRVPVELILYWLFLNKAVPELMTFEGRNFDIIAGITAPVIAYFGLVKIRIDRKLILIWNIICLGLLINIVVNAFLSAPSQIQKFAFDQPNIAILHFPFSWLPTFIVPVVLLAHLTSVIQLLKYRKLSKGQNMK